MALTGWMFEEARGRIACRLHRTPVVSATELGRELGVRLWFKAELLQKTGSFKVRGVLNTLLGMSSEEVRRGFVSISAGNHAAALAWASAAVGAKAIVIMPATAVPSKVEATRRYGAEVVLTEGDLLAECEALRERTGSIFVHPFDDERIMAGHGTLGLEIVEAVPDVDVVVVPVGGGGLIGGVATAIGQAAPRVRVIGVEPTGAALMARSLEAGSPQRSSTLSTIADGLAAPFVGGRNLDQVRRHVERMVQVDDAAIIAALRTMLFRTKLAVEPSAAAPLAALRQGDCGIRPGERVVCVASGGNLDPGVLAALA